MENKPPETGPTIPGPYLTPKQTESSPLTQTFFGSTKKSIEAWLWGWDFSVDGSGSLKSIVVVLFGSTAVITLVLMTQLYYGEYQNSPHGAVSTDNALCTQIGVDVLEKGGNAVDAAVAATMCLGVVNFHITGLGGGGYFLGYDHKQQKVLDVINFLPTVPPSSGHPAGNITTQGQSVGVPGFLAGLWAAHQRNGRMPWSDLLMPSVLLARNGFTVSETLAATASCVQRDFESSDLKNLLAELIQGQNASLPRLAATLELIATKGASVFYNGTLADEVVYSVKVGNGTMSLSDLSSYQPTFPASLKTKFLDFNVIVPASSFGGDLLLNTLETIQSHELRPDEALTADTVRKLSDVIYDTYQSLLQKSQSSLILPPPAASVVAVMDNDDNYVSIVSGLNSWLGAQLLTESGFLLNNALLHSGQDMENPPISLATPVVIAQADNVCGLRAASGAADARTMAQVLTELLMFGKETNSSIEAPRFELGSIPRAIILEDLHEPKLSEITLDALKSMEINVGVTQHCSEEKDFLPYNSINIITKRLDALWPYSDSRGFGEALQF